MPQEVLRIDAEAFRVLASDTLAHGLTLRFRACGQSMRPTIHDGDVLTVMPLDERGLKLGDVVLHQAVGGGLLAHRILYTTRHGRGRTLHTRGDASGGASERVREENVLGRVTRIERQGVAIRLDRLAERLKGEAWAMRQTLRQLYRRRVPYPVASPPGPG